MTGCYTDANPNGKNRNEEALTMKKILAMVLALALVLSVAAATAEYKTIEAGKFIYATSPDFPPLKARMTMTTSSVSSPTSWRSSARTWA